MRGTRPRNRRSLIVSAASDLFVDRGYSHVGMGHIAEAVAIGPSALYRHFPGKQALLAEVISAGLDPIRDSIAALDLGDRVGALTRLGALTLEARHLGVLWQRESRHLAADERTRLTLRVGEIGGLLAERVRHALPEASPLAAEVLTWSTIAVLTSVSFHRLDLPRPAFDEFLGELAGTVLATELPPVSLTKPRPRRGPPLRPNSRREALLAEAVRLFARSGYAAVSIEQIGASLGLTGPAVYGHFPTKVDLLATAVRRGTAALFGDLAGTYAEATDAAEALGMVVNRYLTFARRHPDAVGLLVTELEHLPAEEYRAARQAQHEYVSEWVHLLHGVHGELHPTLARLRVHAALGVLNDVLRLPYLRHADGAAAAVELIARRLLLLPEN